ncbi:MAG: hypothetical protein ABI596_01755, partial [Pyrinomonadaceae bacterium]
PLRDNNNEPFARAEFESVRKYLTEHFGGVTAFLRSPGEGLWKESDNDISHDVVVMFEVMAEELDTSWWAEYREALQREFRQEELMIRALEVTKL